MDHVRGLPTFDAWLQQSAQSVRATDIKSQIYILIAILLLYVTTGSAILDKIGAQYQPVLWPGYFAGMIVVILLFLRVLTAASNMQIPAGLGQEFDPLNLESSVLHQCSKQEATRLKKTRRLRFAEFVFFIYVVSFAALVVLQPAVLRLLGLP